MMVDSELNICHECEDTTKKPRNKLWSLHTTESKNKERYEVKGEGEGELSTAFKKWGDTIMTNKWLQPKKATPYASLVEFLYSKNTLKDMD